ncbi:histidine phosphatase family protein [Streptomyces sp. NPDC048462]|uniref:histidine phosphatase family protein n=1 Tax=Streptomyces sp. NPDC048462 TaxID=3365555 RepID=UPI003721A7D5
MNSRAMTSIRLVYEAYATITDNEAGIATGWLQGVLSATGRLQARELADRRRDDGIAAVFTSDLHPAMSTARIAFAGNTVPIHHDPPAARMPLRTPQRPAAGGSCTAAGDSTSTSPSPEARATARYATEDFLTDLTNWWPATAFCWLLTRPTYGHWAAYLQAPASKTSSEPRPPGNPDGEYILPPADRTGEPSRSQR